MLTRKLHILGDRVQVTKKAGERQESPASESNLLFIMLSLQYNCLGFPGGSEVKNPPANAGDAGSKIP